MSLEQYLAVFYNKVDKTAVLIVDSKLRGRRLLHQSSLELEDRNIVVGAAAGSYDIIHLETSIGNFVWIQEPIDSSMRTQTVQCVNSNTGTSRNNLPYV